MTVTPSDHSTLGIEKTLGVGRGAVALWQRWWVWLIAAIVVALTGYYVLKPAAPIEYVQKKIERGTIIQTVSATGSLEPVDKVTVGAEISGRVDAVLADFNDRVKKGQVLARINTDDLKSRMLQARAGLESARASVKQNDAALADAARILARTQKLKARGYASQAALDTAGANADRARANLDAARAAVNQQAAALALAETNLEKAVIKSPIDGVVLDRRIEAGQTVQASFQAPELFVVASDLTKLELQVYIDEADVALVKAGQPATFNVDAYPSRSFDARVETLRTAPRILNNVVAYLALLSVDNRSGLLRPGLTAGAEITVRRADNALSIPNSALRFDPGAKTTASDPFAGAEIAPERRRNLGEGEEAGRVFVLNAKSEPEAREVTTGITNGSRTELRGGPLKEGDSVIIDTLAPGTKAQP